MSYVSRVGNASAMLRVICQSCEFIFYVILEGVIFTSFHLFYLKPDLFTVFRGSCALHEATCEEKAAHASEVQAFMGSHAAGQGRKKQVKKHRMTWDFPLF